MSAVLAVFILTLTGMLLMTVVMILALRRSRTLQSEREDRQGVIRHRVEKVETTHGAVRRRSPVVTRRPAPPSTKSAVALKK
jgi:hypothetical protein